MKLPKVLLPALCALAYPLCSHWAALGGAHRSLWQWLALMSVVSLPLLPALWQRRRWALALWLTAAAVFYVLVDIGGGRYVLYLPPLILPAVLSASFASTLLPGKTPIISAIANAARGPLTPELWRYTRRLTQFWAGFTALLVLIALALTLFASLWLWSWFTNVVSYALVAAVFVGEYLLRRQWFPDHPHPRFFDYLRIVAKGPPR